MARYRMKVICAWCKAVIGSKISDKPRQISHGVCPVCEIMIRAEMESIKLRNQAKI